MSFHRGTSGQCFSNTFVGYSAHSHCPTVRIPAHSAARSSPPIPLKSDKCVIFTASTHICLYASPRPPCRRSARMLPPRSLRKLRSASLPLTSRPIPLVRAQRRVCVCRPAERLNGLHRRCHQLGDCPLALGLRRLSFIHHTIPRFQMPPKQRWWKKNSVPRLVLTYSTSPISPSSSIHFPQPWHLIRFTEYPRGFTRPVGLPTAWIRLRIASSVILLP